MATASSVCVLLLNYQFVLLCLLGTFPVTFSPSELGAGTHNFTIVGVSNGVTIVQSIIITSECV